MAEAITTGQAERSGRRHALLIATSEYSEKSLDSLPAAKNDLVALTAVLGPQKSETLRSPHSSTSLKRLPSVKSSKYLRSRRRLMTF